MAEIIFLILAIVLMLIGLGGVILPFVPGVPLVWLGLFIFALATGFKTISLATILIFLALTIALTVLDFTAPLWGAKRYQASKWGIVGTFLATIVGIFFLGVWGIVLGPFLGAFIGELITGRGEKQAFKSASGALLGIVLSTLVRLILALIMFGFLIAAL
ncbi:MAG: hypothetical protein UV65_C0012G0019 [Parcubacteria group bacterium GW2011_GWF2_43_11]|nr:MAG: hypothetical protein UV65_C0012G0019 [Parcubacteria group bacterium GW2011_GWF2_43_11]